MTQAPDVVRELPEQCAIGEVVLPQSVPHWDSRIRLTEFSLMDQKPDENPWIFAASYKGMDVISWRRIE